MLNRLALLALCLAAPHAAGQTLTQSALIPGQLATFQATGLAPNSLAFLGASLTGTGGGPCYLPGATGCINLLPPVYLITSQLTSPSGTVTYQLPVPATLPLVTLHTQVVGASAPSGVLVLETTNPISAALQTIAALGDDFEGATLDPAWQLLHPELATITQTGGELVLDPHTGGGLDFWYHDGEGVYVYRPVTGDFTATAIVHAHKPGNPGAPPATSYRLGGLLVRDGSQTASGAHEWAHIATGSGTSAAPMGVENKTTLASNSSFQIHPTSSTQLELRIQRRGASINQFWRPLGGGPWNQIASYPHPNFGATVQVGMMAYSSNASPNVTVRFQAITFAP